MLTDPLRASEASESLVWALNVGDDGTIDSNPLEIVSSYARRSQERDSLTASSRSMPLGGHLSNLATGSGDRRDELAAEDPKIALLRSVSGVFSCFVKRSPDLPDGGAAVDSKRTRFVQTAVA